MPVLRRQALKRTAARTPSRYVDKQPEPGADPNICQAVSGASLGDSRDRRALLACIANAFTPSFYAQTGHLPDRSTTVDYYDYHGTVPTDVQDAHRTRGPRDDHASFVNLWRTGALLDHRANGTDGAHGWLFTQVSSEPG